MDDEGRRLLAHARPVGRQADAVDVEADPGVAHKGAQGGLAGRAYWSFQAARSCASVSATRDGSSTSTTTSWMVPVKRNGAS